MSDKTFTEITKEILLRKPEFDERRISGKEFESIKSNNKQECILVFGMNPAGDEKDADAERAGTYLYDLQGYSIDHRTYPKYYGPIFEAVQHATNNNAKWAWCNYDSNHIDGIIGEDKELQQHCDRIKRIKKHYCDYKDKKYSIYIGDFFYYHETNQRDFLKLVDQSKIHKHMIEMLNSHIDELVSNGNSIELIYINNARASHFLYETLRQEQKSDNSSWVDSSWVDYEHNNVNYRVLLGSMLSGQRAMDVFSRARLVQEMKETLDR